MHKYFVAIECFKVGLYWRGIKHDWHKFLPSEWFPYVNHFYGLPNGSISKGRDSTGYYGAGKTGEEKFDFAWLLHQKRADHHWQWYILQLDDGGIKIFPMSDDSRLEMLCDWCGASKAQKKGGWLGAKIWYRANHDKMILHKNTREWIEEYLSRKT